MNQNIKQITAKLRHWPIDQVFMESVPCTVYKNPDGTPNVSQLILDVWASALDNVDQEADKSNE